MADLAARLQERDVVGLNDFEAAVALNTRDPLLPTKRGPISRKDAFVVLLNRGAWGYLKGVADGWVDMTGAQPDATTLRATVVTVVGQLERGDITELDVTADDDYGQLQQVLGLLVLNGAITRVDSQHMTDILALAQRPQSWAEANGFPKGVTVDDVFAARGRQRVITDTTAGAA